MNDQCPDLGRWVESVSGALFPGKGVTLTPDQAVATIAELHKREDDARDALRKILTLVASMMPEYHNGTSPGELEVLATVKECLKLGQGVLK